MQEDPNSPIATASSRWRWGTIAIAALVYLGLALAHQGILTTDIINMYHPVALDLLRGEGGLAFARDVNRGPTYASLLALTLPIWRGDLVRAYQTISLLSAVAMLCMAGALIRRGWGERAALWVTLFTAVNPYFVRLAVFDGNDMPMFALALGALSLAWMIGGARGWFLAGLCGALTVGVKNSGLWILGWGLLAIWISPEEASIRRRAWWLLLFIAGHALLLGPWLVLNASLHGGDPLYSTNSITLHPSLYPPQAVVEGAFVTDVIRLWPVMFFIHWTARVVSGLWEIPWTLLPWAPLAVLGMVGIIALAIDRREWRWRWGLFLFFVTQWGLTSLAGMRPRLVLIWLPLLGLGLVRLIDLIPVGGNENPLRRWLRPGLCVAIAVTLAGMTGSVYLNVRRETQERVAPARALADWFSTGPRGRSQAILVHPHDPARSILARGEGPIPLADTSKREVLASWALFNPALMSPQWLEDLPSNWEEIGIPGLAPCRLFQTNSVADDRSRGEFALVGLPMIDSTNRLIHLTLRNQGEETGRAILTLRQRVLDAVHWRRYEFLNYYNPRHALVIWMEPMVVGNVDLLRTETPAASPGEEIDLTLPVPPSFPDNDLTLIVNEWSHQGRGDEHVNLGTLEGDSTLTAFDPNTLTAVITGENLVAQQDTLARAASGDVEAWCDLSQQWRDDTLNGLALMAARRAQEIDPSNARAMIFRGMAAYELWRSTENEADMAEAEQAFLDYYDADPRQLWALLRLVDMWLRADRPEDVVALLSPHADHSRISPDYHYRLALAHDELGHSAEARDLYRQFLDSLAASDATDAREATARERIEALGD